MLQATELTVHSTAAQITSAVINIVLDPIMIYGLFGFPELKAAGAAYATVIGQIASFMITLFSISSLTKALIRALNISSRRQS